MPYEEGLARLELAKHATSKLEAVHQTEMALKFFTEVRPPRAAALCNLLDTRFCVGTPHPLIPSGGCGVRRCPVSRIPEHHKDGDHYPQWPVIHVRQTAVSRKEKFVTHQGRGVVVAVCQCVYIIV